MKFQRRKKESKWTLEKTLTVLLLVLSGIMIYATVIFSENGDEINSFNSGASGRHTNQHSLSESSSKSFSDPPIKSVLRSTESKAESSAFLPSSYKNSQRGLSGLRILVAIASFDFAQFPLLEEVLDSYQDMCVSGAFVDLYIHTAMPYTVGQIDLLNSRLACDGMSVTIEVQSPSVRLNLVDRHRTLFYEKIDDYDLFIYSEDDIKVSPTTVKAYLDGTKKVEEMIGKSPAEDYNLGVVRYEYNYPPDIVIDDKTRHATQKVTRVYWEHLWKPLFPKSIDLVHQSEVNSKYVSMQNHHQGMYLATRDLLKAWKKRKGCEFDRIRQRPARKDNPSQPTEGTQRVWMSSQMLHGNRHCNVQQLIPMKNFGQFTIWHLPNKNYRRVGKQGRIGGSESAVENEFGTGKEKFRGPDASLPTEMELHLEMRKLYPMTALPGEKYTGIRMINEVDRGARFRTFGGLKSYLKILDKRFDAYHAYVNRGGILKGSDFQDWQWVFEEEEEETL